jgi:ABC-type polysaccharide/polyol phosphate transport system ATPase subunit
MGHCLLQLNGVSKRFVRGCAHDTLVDLVSAGVRTLLGRKRPPAPDDAFWALDDVSFEVQPGQAVGLIGPNGAGKSTALKIITGIMRPDVGHIVKRGRVTAIIEIGAGFHGDLTGRENIYMNAAILGMRTAEIEQKLDAIIDFSGIETFIDTPLKRYSSGMQARLGFAVAAHVEPDVLLVDEVLSVGDVVFRQKCIQRMREIVKNGAILLFVTHQLDQMQSFCSRGIVLDRGRLIYDGQTGPAVAKYIESLKDKEGFLDQCQSERIACVTGFSVVNTDRQDVLTTHAHDPITLRVEFNLAKPLRELVVEVDVRRDIGNTLANFSSVRDETTFDAPAGNSVVDLSLPSLPLAGGQHFWRVILRDAISGQVIADTDYRYSTFVEDDGRATGILCIPHQWTFLDAPDTRVAPDTPDAQPSPQACLTR